MTFYDKMRLVCLAIPPGHVATYGQIALLCGQPKNARQVGYGLRQNLAGPDIPAFRVVNSRGELSGSGHFPAPGLQQALLEAEGVTVFWNGRAWQVDLKQFGWHTTVADAEALFRWFSPFSSSMCPKPESDFVETREKSRPDS